MKLLNAGAAIVELWIPRAYHAVLVRPNKAKLIGPPPPTTDEIDAGTGGSA